MSNVERARQFMPFAALKGFDVIVKEQEKTVCNKRELSDEDYYALSETLSRVKKGDVVRLSHYDGEGYVLTEGMVSKIDFDGRVITVIKTEILFEDIAEAKIL
ncbi:MAG: hypothetical protein MJ072_01505 [Clostridia bacterium]|nr:hypothetical protein [Clostridia bacterium]